MFSSDVCRCLLTYIPCISPNLSPAFRAKVVSAFTPMESRTKSDSNFIPDLKCTVILPSLPVNDSTASLNNSCMPFSCRCLWTNDAMEKSMGFMTWLPISTMLTLAPAWCRFSAISRPMNPPPTITAFFISFCCM